MTFFGPLEPVVAEELDRMWRADGTVSTPKIILGTVLVAPPANTLWMTGMKRSLSRHVIQHAVRVHADARSAPSFHFSSTHTKGTTAPIAIANKKRM